MRAAFVVALLAGCASADRNSSDAPALADAPVDAKHVVDAPVDAESIDAFLCATSPCSLSPQCGCAADQGCDLNASDPTKTVCRPETATGVEGTHCTFSSQCAAGYGCINDSAGTNCARWCTTTADCLSPRGQCVDPIDSGSTPIPGAVVCSSNCDPVAASNPLCPPSTTCDLFTSSFNGSSVDVVECRGVGTAGLNAACSTTTACSAGLTCATVNGTNKCVHLCAPPANTGCPTSTTCTGFATAFTVGGTQYGVCL